MAKQQHPKAVLRLLLRVVDKHITSVAGNPQWRQHVLQQFRQHKDADLVQQQRLLLMAQEYADLVRNIAHHQELLDTYNIGKDPEARNKEMVEKTAARVGFKLPDADTATTQDASTSIPHLQQEQQEQQPLQQQRDSAQHQAQGAAASDSSSSSSGSSRKGASMSGLQETTQDAATLAAAG